MALTNPMTKGVYLGLIPQIVNSVQVGVVPNAGGSVTFYAAGTTNPQTVYTDPGLTVPYPSPGNVVNLNSSGYAVIYLSNMAYKYVEADSLGNPVFVQDNYLQGGSGSGFGGIFVSNIAALKALNPATYSFAYIAGYYANGDGGSGLFYNAVSSAPDDGGYTIKSTFDATVNWFRVPDEDGEIRAASFGYIPQLDNADYPVGYSPITSLQAADAYASTNNATLSIQGGTAATITTTALNAPFVRYEANAELKGASATTVTHNGIVIAGNQAIFGANITAVLSGKQIAIPEWFGASTSLGDNSTAFTAMFGSGAGGFKINPGTWVCSALTPPTDKRIISFGKVWDGSSTVFIPIGEYYLEVGNALLVDGPISSLGTSGGVTTSGQVYCASLQSVGNAQIGGSLVTGTSINAGTTIEAAGDITADNTLISHHQVVAGTLGVGGYLQAQAGTGTKTFKAAGRIINLVGSAAVTGINPTDLLSATIPINTLVNVGDALRVVITGTADDTTEGAAFDIKTEYGGVTVSEINPTSGTLFISWTIIIDIVVLNGTATNNLLCNTAMIIPLAIPSASKPSQITASVNLTSATVLKVNAFSGAGGGNDTITQTQFMVDYYPA